MNDNAPVQLHRWSAKITYRHDDGPQSRLFNFEELEELQEIVERGPNFYAIESIVVIPGDRCPKVTVEGTKIVRDHLRAEAE